MEKKLSILLVDDEAIVGNRLKPALTKIGYDVEAFEDPKDAMLRLDEKEFDIVITDIMMSEVNGIQLLEFVQSKNERTKVIMITGYASEDVVNRCVASDVHHLLEKPIEPYALQLALRAIVAKYDPPATGQAFSADVFAQTLIYAITIETIGYKQRER